MYFDIMVIVAQWHVDKLVWNVDKLVWGDSMACISVFYFVSSPAIPINGHSIPFCAES